MALRRLIPRMSAACPLMAPRTVNILRSGSKFVQPSNHSACVILKSKIHTASPILNKFIINIQDEEDFQKRVMENKSPVIVDFHADWCGPCKTLGPRLESLVASKEGKVILAKVDVDSVANVAMEYDVQAIPTVISMKEGKIVDTFVGLKDDTGLDSFVNSLILE